MGFAGSAKFKDEDNNDLKAGFGLGGLFLEYIVGLPKLVHLSFPLNIMAGGVNVELNQVNNNNDDDDVESSAFFALEPGLNLELNVSKFFILGANVSYRFATGSNLKNLSDEDISGLSFGLVIKFGNLTRPFANS